MNEAAVPAEAGEVSLLLRSWRGGDPEAFARLAPLVYQELRRLAGHCMAGERSDHTLQPTALVHEACLRLMEREAPHWQDRNDFFAAAAQTMRRLLVDHARAHRAAKRGGGAAGLPLDAARDLAQPEGERPEDLLALDAALTALAAESPRQVRAVELRYFAGLTLEETAAALAVSPATVVVELRHARTWLHRHLAQGGTA